MRICVTGAGGGGGGDLGGDQRGNQLAPLSLTLTSTTRVVRPRWMTSASAVRVPWPALPTRLTESWIVRGNSSGLSSPVGLASHMAAAVAVSSAKAVMAPAGEAPVGWGR